MAITTIFLTLFGQASGPAQARPIPAHGNPTARQPAASRRSRLLAFWRRDASSGRPVCTWRAAAEEESAEGQRSLVLRGPWAGVAMVRLFRAANARRLAA